jgi:hypothetical protein
MHMRTLLGVEHRQGSALPTDGPMTGAVNSSTFAGCAPERRAGLRCTWRRLQTIDDDKGLTGGHIEGWS